MLWKWYATEKKKGFFVEENGHNWIVFASGIADSATKLPER